MLLIILAWFNVLSSNILNVSKTKGKKKQLSSVLKILMGGGCTLSCNGSSSWLQQLLPKQTSFRLEVFYFI